MIDDRGIIGGMASKRRTPEPLSLVHAQPPELPPGEPLRIVIGRRLHGGYQRDEARGRNDLLRRFDLALLALAGARDELVLLGSRERIEQEHAVAQRVWDERFASSDTSEMGREIAMNATAVRGDSLRSLARITRFERVADHVDEALRPLRETSHQEKRHALAVHLELCGSHVRNSNLDANAEPLDVETVKAAALREAERFADMLANDSSWRGTLVARRARSCVPEIMTVLLAHGRGPGQPRKGSPAPKGPTEKHVEALFKKLGLEGARSTLRSSAKRAVTTKKK